jgi:Tfp pilus assembly protein PilP
MPIARLNLIAVIALAVAVATAQAQSEPAQSAQQPPQKPAPAAEPQKPSPQAAAPKAGSRGAGAPKPQEATAAAEQLIEPTGFDYKPEGRRDPFVSLVRRIPGGRGGRGAAASVVSRAAGVGGLAIDEVTLRGTIRGREGFVAMIQGADQKTYIVRPGDRLSDGTIRTITQSDMVVVQQVNDPLSLEKQREVRKVLRQTEANP